MRNYINCIDIPKEFGNIDEYHRFLLSGIDKDREECLDLLYRSSYKYMINQLGKYHEFDTVDNLMCYGNVSFMKAVEGYDVGRNNSFLAFFNICLRNEIYNDYLCRYMVDGKRYSIIKKTISYDDGMLEFLDNGVSIENDVIYKELLKGLYEYIERIEDNELHRDVFRYYIRFKLSGRTIKYENMVEKFGISKGYISKIINKMKDKIELYFREG